MSDTLARDYALGICNDLEGLCWLEDNWQTVVNWDHLEALMEHDRMEPAAIKSARLMLTDNGPSWDDHGGPAAAFFANDVLDIVKNVSYSFAAESSTLENVEALITFGGPNAWIISTDGEELKVKVSWGGDLVEMYADAACVSSYLYGLGDLI
jgi:hypothetical protein